MKKVLYITILACSTLWGSCTEKNKQSARTDSFIYNPQIEMFARFKMKSSFHKTKRII